MRIPWLFDLPCSDYDIPAIELWLSDQARRGKLLTAWRVFEPCPPRACLYALEPAGKEEYKPSEEKQEAYAQAGWEYVCFTSGDVFIVWRSTRPDPAPLRTDPAADSYAYSYLWKKYCRNTVGAVLLCAAFLALFLWMAARGGLAAYNLVTNAGIAWTQVFVIVFLLLLIGITAADTRMLRRLLKALAAGVPMPERRPTRRRLAVNRLLRWVFVVYWIVYFPLIWFSYPENVPLPEEEPPSFVTAEMLGGAPGETWNSRSATLLGGTVWRGREGQGKLLKEPDRFGLSGRRIGMAYDTETRIFAPRLGFLAGPLVREMAGAYVPLDAGAPAEPIDPGPFDAAYYLAAGGVQHLAVRLGGRVLYLRTTAPADLRSRLEEFAALLGAWT